MTTARAPEGRVGVLLVNFGEPAEPTSAGVEAYLKRIFHQNRALEPGADGAGAARARQLAEARAPALLQAYRDIGGSPLNAQADAQARALQEAMRSHGSDARVYSAFQFTPPSIPAQAAQARADGVETLVGLPLYPLCGRSTTVAALDAVQEALDDLAWNPVFAGVSGWHHHPSYVILRVDDVRAFLELNRIDIRDADTLLYFSVHGTPVRYLNEGSRYDRYVEEHCRDVARRLGTDRYAVGFQNHTNRAVEWTRPGNEDRIREAPERTLVVVPISFMHEQSETLAELDGELRAFAEGLGKELHRVPVPHDDPRFPRFLADLVAEAVAATASAAPGQWPGESRQSPVLTRCGCRPAAGTWCTNGGRNLPPSPYARTAPG